MLDLIPCPCFCFNPHPALKPGASEYKAKVAPLLDGFNPHPALKPGASAIIELVAFRFKVSILTRP